MNKWSLKVKLLLAASVIMLTVMGALATTVRQSMKEANNDASSDASDAMKAQTFATMSYATESAAKEVSSYLDSSFTLPKSVANNLKKSSVHSGGTPFSREQVKSLLRNSLDSYPRVSSIYAHFEPNGYDGQDNEFLFSPEHSTNIGTLELYWYRDGGTLHFDISDPAEKYLTALDEFGNREAEWYLCSRDSGRPCVMEPYLYEIQAGKEELMTSLIWPVMVEEQFRGIVGIDINLPVVQQVILNASTELFDNKGNMLLLSEKGLIVASSRHADKLGRPLSEVEPTLELLLRTGNQQNIETDTVFLTSAVIKVQGSNTTWRLIYRLPKTVALAELTSFQQRLQSGFDTTMLKMISFILVGTLLAVGLLSLIISSFTKPLISLSDRVIELGGAEGDLTQTLEIDQHKELIQMSVGFNTFIQKLKEMVLEMKTQSQILSEHSSALSSAAASSSEASRQQTYETEGVVTAMHEMSETASQVAMLAQNTSVQANNSNEVLGQVKTAFSFSLSQIQAVSNDMEQASYRVSQVAERSNEISGILDTIRGIAEQTNLLALNAAIEAARAGEQGRGFAVVADEVRSLAARTQNSTAEIDGLIQGLQQEVESTVSQIEKSKERVSITVSDTEKSYGEMTRMEQMITGINDNAAQVATAAEEQSHVSEEINRNLTVISDSGKEIAQVAHEVSDVSHLVEKVVQSLEGQLAKFKAE